MIDDDNSVNIENEKSRYHHGDLRTALIAEGLRLLTIEDVEQLSLRQIARNVGVSPTAVYRHFPDKQALLAALAMEGGSQLAQRQKDAQAAAGGGRAGFDETGRVYVRFALENPALFRLMTAHSRAGNDTCPEEQRGGLGLLRRNIAALAAPGTSEEIKRADFVRSWAIVHGLAMLMLDGQVPQDEALIDLVVATAKGKGSA
jgi:AcrR family transcriptional regulator